MPSFLFINCVTIFRQYSDKILMHFKDIGRKSPTFGDASGIANEILNLDYDFEHCELYFNVFK